MRVAFVSMRTTHHEESGSMRRMRRLAESLAARGHEVVICCSQWWDGDQPTAEENDVTYRRVCRQPRVGAFLQGLPGTLRIAAPEVIHVHQEPPLAAVVARLTGLFRRVPTLLEWWDAPRERPERLLHRGHRWAVRLPELVISPSQMGKTQVREYGADPEDVRVIPSSVDLSMIDEAPVDDRADVVYARDLDADANVEEFLLALAELRNREWRATIIGDGPAREDAEETAAELRIDERVEFLGDLPIKERVPIYKGAHVFAQTARHEAFATDLLWALACGCVGIVEYQVESSAHELVEGRDRHALVTSPQELAAGIEAAARVDRREIDEAFAEYDHEAVLEEYLACYREGMAEYGLL